jgi:hypothetical protein
METPIQELISEMEQLKETKLYTGSFKAIEDCLCLAYAKLEKEKQQIIDAFIGYDSDTKDNLEVAEQYYKETFKQEEQWNKQQ